MRGLVVPDWSDESKLSAGQYASVHTLLVEVGLEELERQCVVQDVDVALSGLRRSELGACACRDERRADSDDARVLQEVAPVAFGIEVDNRLSVEQRSFI